MVAVSCSAPRIGTSVTRKPWLTYALVTTFFWGVWGAFAEFPTRHGFPETLVYVVWALTMIPPALYAMRRVGWKIAHDRRSIFLGVLIGLTGAGGQMLLFHAVHTGPTYLIFPIIALSPVITIALSMALLKERVSKTGAFGVVLALLALPLFNYVPGGESAAPVTHGVAWFAYALIILLAWGVQAYFMKLANGTMNAENIFLYMTLSGLVLIPVALWMTDFSIPINYGWQGPGLAAITQILNAVGALTLVYAFRYGRAIVVAPLANAGAPLMTAVVSMIVLGVMPNTITLAGIALACVAALLLAIEPEQTTAAAPA
ncbi:MAG: DMT family transporter [Gammaproteobacteria bacterium]